VDSLKISLLRPNSLWPSVNPVNDPPVPIGANIRRLREARKLSQDELGEAVGVSGQTIQNIEVGRTEPQPRVRAAIAAFLGVDEPSLYEPPPPELETAAPPLRELVAERAAAGRPIRPEHVERLLRWKFRGKPRRETFAFILASLESESEG
jgi:transcriptional regulator with XRE-family HTH domain